MHIKKKDKVIVLAGKDKGKTGDVLKIFPSKRTAIVSKVNFVKRHTKPTQTDSGGIREKEAPVSVARLMLVCPKCDKPTRKKWEILSDGKKTRICKKCGEMIM
ncbi:MAG: 50S ribosomal protein L24 [Elusimicrobia bacterium]|nr:50S ribosomal protein L24 [Elusimicrobiota bacterium]